MNRQTNRQTDRQTDAITVTTDLRFLSSSGIGSFMLFVLLVSPGCTNVYIYLLTLGQDVCAYLHAVSRTRYMLVLHKHEVDAQSKVGEEASWPLPSCWMDIYEWGKCGVRLEKNPEKTDRLCVCVLCLHAIFHAYFFPCSIVCFRTGLSILKVRNSQPQPPPPPPLPPPRVGYIFVVLSICGFCST